MAVIKLDPGESTTVPAGTLTLTWQVRGLDPAGLQLRFERTDAPGQPSPAAQATGPNSWVVPALPIGATVLVRPADGGVFPDGVQVDLQLALRLGAATGDEFVLPSVNVSGTSQATLLQLIPLGGTWQLSAPQASVAPPTPGVKRVGGAGSAPRGTAPALPPLAERTMYRARELAGPTGVVRPEFQTQLHVAIDASASMLPLVRTGARQAALEIAAGVNAVVGLTSELPVWQLGTVPERQSTGLSPATVATYDDVLGRVPRTTGTVVAPLVAATAAPNIRRTVIVITDGVPADLDDLDDALATAKAAGSSTRWHLLVFGRSMSDPAVRLEPWRDELTALRPLESSTLTASSITPGTGEGWLTQRLQGNDALTQVVSGLGLLDEPGR